MSEQKPKERFDRVTTDAGAVASTAIVRVAASVASRRVPAVVATRAALARVSSGPLPKYVRAEEVRAVIEVLKDRVRERSFLRCLWELGPRISELLGVVVSDIDFAAQTMQLRTLKRRRPLTRALPLSSSLLGEVAVLINGAQLTRQGRLFPWSRSRGFEIVRDALLAAGVDRARANARSLRHGHAVHALLNGVPLNVLQEALGHASAVTTAIYTRVLGRDIADYYREVAW